MNFLSLSSVVHDNKSSIQFLQRRGILHTSRKCSKGHDMNLSVSDSQERWRCSRRECRQDITIRKDTWLEGSKLSFRQIVMFIYCWSSEMTNVKFTEKELDICQETTVDWNNYLREVCAFHLLQNPIIIGGPGTTVEIDESVFTRRKSNVGRVLPQQWVFGGICRETSECFMFAVENRRADTLMPIIQQYILPGTHIISDQWPAYNGITAAPGMNYTHNTVNHSRNFVDPNTGANTQRIERSWKAAKERNKRHNGTHRQMLDSYLCEFMWRRRLAAAGIDPFDAILGHIVAFWPPG